MDQFKHVTDPNCPKGTMYVIDAKAIGTLAEQPEIVLALAEGREVIVSSTDDARRLKEASEAMKRVGRIDL